MTTMVFTKTGRVLVAAALLGASSCTTRPENVEARYVSPITYQGYSCDQLTEERTRLAQEVERVFNLQRENATGDTIMLTFGLILFWPALIGMAATKDRKDELGKLKGEYEAVDEQIKIRQCIVTTPVIVPPPAPTSVTPRT